MTLLRKVCAPAGGVTGGCTPLAPAWSFSVSMNLTFGQNPRHSARPRPRATGKRWLPLIRAANRNFFSLLKVFFGEVFFVALRGVSVRCRACPTLPRSPLRTFRAEQSEPCPKSRERKQGPPSPRFRFTLPKIIPQIPMGGATVCLYRPRRILRRVFFVASSTPATASHSTVIAARASRTAQRQESHPPRVVDLEIVARTTL